MHRLWKKFLSCCRGTPTQFNLFVSILLGFILGTIPVYTHSTLLWLVLLVLLLLLNTNVILAATAFCTSKLITVLLLPWAFSVGVFLIETLSPAAFTYLINAPVTALLGLEYYATTGSLIFGSVLGTMGGVTALWSIYRRERTANVSNAAGIEGEAFSEDDLQRDAKLVRAVFGETPFQQGAVNINRGARKAFLLLRPTGFVFVLILVFVGLFTGVLFSNAVFSQFLEKKLGHLNGATVDISQTTYTPFQSRLVIDDLAVADPEKLDRNRFTASQVVVDINNLGLLSGKWIADEVRLEGVQVDTSRQDQAVRMGEDAAELAFAEKVDIGPFFEKTRLPPAVSRRLERVKKWVRILSEGWERSPTSNEPITFLENRASEKGYAYVAARHHIRKQPDYLVRSLVINELHLPWLKDDRLRIKGENLSGTPSLIDASSSLELTSKSGRFFSRFTFDPATTTEEETAQSDIRVDIKEIPVSFFEKIVDLREDLRFTGGNVYLNASGRIYPAPIRVPLHIRIEDPSIEMEGEDRLEGDNFSFELRLTGTLNNPDIEFVECNRESRFTERLAKKLKHKLKENADKFVEEYLERK